MQSNKSNANIFIEVSRELHNDLKTALEKNIYNLENAKSTVKSKLTERKKQNINNGGKR